MVFPLSLIALLTCPKCHSSIVDSSFTGVICSCTLSDALTSNALAVA